MRTAAYKVDVAMRPPQARVSQAKLFSCLKNRTGHPLAVLEILFIILCPELFNIFFQFFHALDFSQIINN